MCFLTKKIHRKQAILFNWHKYISNNQLAVGEAMAYTGTPDDDTENV